MQPLQSKWFKGIPESEKADFEQLVRNSTIILGQLTSILEASIQELESKQVSDYDNLNWPYRQADRNGELRTLRNILKLTKVERTL